MSGNTEIAKNMYQHPTDQPSFTYKPRIQQMMYPYQG